jgi:hypothetical protein
MVLWMAFGVVTLVARHAASQRRHFPDATCIMEGSNARACLEFDSPADFQDFMTHCAWRPAGPRIHTFYAWQSWNRSDIHDGMIPLTSVRNEHCGWREWSAFRIGPFNTTGGMSWTGIASVVNHTYLTPHARLPNGQDMFAFSHYVMGNVDEESRLMPYPPIHQHHWHLTGGFSMLPDEMNNHGDSQCAESQGGVGCLSRTLPRGYAHMLQPRLLIWTEYNDVRYNGSTPLPSYFFIALKTVPANVPVRQMRMQLLNVALPLSMKVTRTAYEVRTHAPSVTWAAGRIDWSRGRLAEAYFHGHMSGLYDIWIFQGRPEQVFADPSALAASRNDVVYGAEYMMHIVASIRRRSVEEDAAPLACSYVRNSQSDYICDDRQAVCANFNRKARCPLDSNKTDWVLVAFHRAMPSAQPYIHHAFVRVYTLAEDDYAELVEDMGVGLDDMAFTVRTHANPHIDKLVIPNMWPGKSGRYRL